MGSSSKRESSAPSMPQPQGNRVTPFGNASPPPGPESFTSFLPNTSTNGRADMATGLTPEHLAAINAPPPVLPPRGGDGTSAMPPGGPQGSVYQQMLKFMQTPGGIGTDNSNPFSRAMGAMAPPPGAGGSPGDQQAFDDYRKQQRGQLALAAIGRGRGGGGRRGGSQ